MTTPSYSTTESGAVIIHQHHTHNHFEDDPRMSEALDALAAMQIEQQAAAVALRTLGATTMALVDEFRAEITQLREIRPAMEAAFAKIEARLEAALADNAEDAALRTGVEGVLTELRDRADCAGRRRGREHPGRRAAAGRAAARRLNEEPSMADDTTAPASDAPVLAPAATGTGAPERPDVGAAPKSVTVPAAHFVSGSSARPNPRQAGLVSRCHQ